MKLNCALAACVFAACTLPAAADTYNFTFSTNNGDTSGLSDEVVTWQSSTDVATVTYPGEPSFSTTAYVQYYFGSTTDQNFVLGLEFGHDEETSYFENGSNVFFNGSNLIPGTYTFPSGTETYIFAPDNSLAGDTLTIATVTPEPSSFVLLGSGILGVAGVMRRRLA